MNPALERCQRMLSSGAQIEEIVSTLRSCGFSKVDSIKAIAELTGRSLLEAKQVVHTSLAWRDGHDAGEHLHDVLERSISDDAPGKK